MNKRIIRQHFRVDHLDKLSAFYTDILGMKEIACQFDQGAQSLTFGYDDYRCGLQFDQKPVTSFQARPDDFYWKIGITLRDLDVAIDFLRHKGLLVPDAVQFRDIGYMSKITDPNGFIIELLQQGFEGNARPVPDGHPIGTQATLAHITLRITDLDAARSFFEQALGMRLMSIQKVADHGFCLYFYSWSDETLPDPDLEAVENREWLWARPYTFIELQHLEKLGQSVHKTAPEMAGFNGFSFNDKKAGSLTLISSEELHNLD